MATSVFIREPKDYSRDLNVVEKASADAALFLSLKTGKPIEDCLSFVQKKVGGSSISPIDVKVLRRKPNGDRAKDTIKISKILHRVMDAKMIISPNMVVYDSPHENKSCTADYVDKKMKDRKVIKKRGFLAKMVGDKKISTYCSNLEAAIKLLINSLSGAHASPHNAHFNKTAHSSLTSTCRTITSYSNAVTERLVMGNRHYFSKDVVVNNILSILNNTNLDRLDAVMLKYNMTYPTPLDVAGIIKRSTDLYWRNTDETLDINNLLHTLTPTQLAAIAYTGDLFHIAKFNESRIQLFIHEIVTRPNLENAILSDDVVDNADDDIIALVGILCADLLKGSTVDNLKASDPSGYSTYIATIDKVEKFFISIADFISVFLTTDNLPPNVYAFPESIRMSVVGSDTDSTMFTVQYWVEWYFGKLCFGSEADKVANALVYINTQVIAHTLALVSKQLGAVDESLYEIKMKNEYAFPVYMKANRAKHYATLISSREGNVYAYPEIDIKGVALKDSKISDEIINGLADEFKFIMDEIMGERGVDVDGLQQRIANTEHLILRSLEAGETTYLSTVNINTKEAYKKPLSSNYLHHDLWSNVFQDKYGSPDDLPYRAVKVSVTLNNIKAIESWFSTMDINISDAYEKWHDSSRREIYESWLSSDEDNIAPYEKWITTNKKSSYTMLLVPARLTEGGLPKEFVSVIDKRKIVSELMEGSYILLEMCGYYFKNNNNTRLISDDVHYNNKFGIIGTGKNK